MPHIRFGKFGACIRHDGIGFWMDMTNPGPLDMYTQYEMIVKWSHLLIMIHVFIATRL